MGDGVRATRAARTRLWPLARGVAVVVEPVADLVVSWEGERIVGFAVVGVVGAVTVFVDVQVIEVTSLGVFLVCLAITVVIDLVSGLGRKVADSRVFGRAIGGASTVRNRGELSNGDRGLRNLVRSGPSN
ncbi:MAG: peptidoglycan/LPS O-acetylase OafA/YrhL [Myxococcota bacterium]